VNLFGEQRRREPQSHFNFCSSWKQRSTVAETQGSDQKVWGDTKEIHWTQERMISSNSWFCTDFSRELQGWNTLYCIVLLERHCHINCRIIIRLIVLERGVYFIPSHYLMLGPVLSGELPASAFQFAVSSNCSEYSENTIFLWNGTESIVTVEWMIGRGNQSTQRNPTPVPLCPPQIPHDFIQVTTVGTQWLITWAVAHPKIPFTRNV
jgi:hypothetical protein